MGPATCVQKFWCWNRALKNVSLGHQTDTISVIPKSIWAWWGWGGVGKSPPSYGGGNNHLRTIV